MKIIFHIVFIFFVLNCQILAQNSYLNLIEKKNYLKAEKKINAALLKTPDDIILNYAKSILLIKRQYENYNPEESYKFLIISQNIFQNISNEKELKRLDKVPINSTIYQNYFDTIYRYSYEDVTTKNTVENYERFLNYFTNISNEYKQKVTEYRNIVAMKIATEKNTIESYQYFITTYPDALQKEEALRKRNNLAFKQAKVIDKIEVYKDFINKYSLADEVSQAWERIYELAFVIAETENTSIAYKKFVDEYPSSKQNKNAFNLYEKTQFYENVKDGNLSSYVSFIKAFPKNSWMLVAFDSIYRIGTRTNYLEILKYCLTNFTGGQRDKLLILFHDIFTDDGETATLDLFYKKYDYAIFKNVKIKDYEIAALGDELFRNTTDYNKYFKYIRLAAPREKAFVALQRIILQFILNKDWQSAINQINEFKGFWGTKNQKLNDLISILNSEYDNSIIINSVGSAINTEIGDEHLPVISANDIFFYFCGKNRSDNIGGEDIFVSEMKKGTWSPAKVVAQLSFANSNDAPLSITADGNTILLFKEGKLNFAKKTNNGWSQLLEFPFAVNKGQWQCDAITSSDDKALLFSSVRNENYNYYTSENNKSMFYHGNDEHASDIYVCLKNENNEWDEPINIGPIINTIYCERSPFLHSDMKTLYFSSDGHGGLGGLDVFKSTRLADTCWDCWSKPINLGKEINTIENDWGYKISTDGEKAYFSNRNNTTRHEDIFWLNLPEKLRPNPVATISGKITDKNKTPISAKIRWEDLETGKMIGQSESDPTDGSYFIVLPLGKNYGYYVDKKEYFPTSSNIDLRNNEKSLSIIKEILLISYKQMLDERITVPINNLFFLTEKAELLPTSIPELKRISDIINKNLFKVEIAGHTDNTGTKEYNQDLSERRAKAVSDYLISLGIDKEMIMVKGFGASKPISSNDTEDGRAKNRRVDLKFTH